VDFTKSHPPGASRLTPADVLEALVSDLEESRLALYKALSDLL
jgi:hypothetical protein